MSLPNRQLTVTEVLRYFKAGELTELEAVGMLQEIMLEIVDSVELWKDRAGVELRAKIEVL